MPAILSEHQQWLDSSGRPLVGGKVYFGDQNADPTTSPQTIFSDRQFTTAISNPQTLDANGRTASKVWIRSRYSIRVDDINDVQQYQELDNGEPEGAGAVTLDNVVGANTIAATASPTITSYVDGSTFVLKTASINGGAVTLNVDSVGAKSVTMPNGDALVSGQWAANQPITLIYNSTTDTFIFDQFDLITQAAAEAGTETVPRLISALRLAQSITALVPAASDTVAGKIEIAVQSEMEAGSSETLAVTPGRQHFHPGVAKFWCHFDGTAANPITPDLDYNVVDVTDVATGRHVVNIDTDFSSADWVPGAWAGDNASYLHIGQDSGVNKAAGTLPLEIQNNSGTAVSASAVAAFGFGDHA